MKVSKRELLSPLVILVPVVTIAVTLCVVESAPRAPESAAPAGESRKMAAGLVGPSLSVGPPASARLPGIDRGNPPHPECDFAIAQRESTKRPQGNLTALEPNAPGSSSSACPWRSSDQAPLRRSADQRPRAAVPATR